MLSRAVHVCDLDPTLTESINLENQKHDLLVQLSSLVDRGRWFFPNVMPELVGHQKPGAFKGIRQAILSRLVMAYRNLNSLKFGDNGNASEIEQNLEAARREFVSDVQKKLEPRRTNEEF